MELTDSASLLTVLQENSTPKATDSGLSGTVALQVNKIKLSIKISDGQVEELNESEQPDLQLKLSEQDLSDIITGTKSFEEDFIRGDVKPEGSTGSILALCELFNKN